MLLNTLLLGLGNPILGDDGVGWRIVDKVRAISPDCTAGNRTPQFEDQSVEFDCAALSGLSLMERLIGYQHVLLVDAIFAPDLPIGEVIFSNIENIPTKLSSRLASIHDTTLVTALTIGRQLGAELPTEISIIGININPSFDFTETLSPVVSASVPKATQLALDWLSQITTRLEVYPCGRLSN